MQKKTIYQLAIVRAENICPVCGERITEHKPCSVMLTAPDQERSQQYICNTLFCYNCNLPFADKSTGRTVFEATGYWLSTFSVPKRCSEASIRNQMYYRRKRHPVTHAKERRASTFELVKNTAVVWKTAQTICSQPTELVECPKCKQKLHADYTLVPVTEQQKAKIPGMLCNNCGTIYVTQSHELAELMRDNPLSKGFTLDGLELWNASIREKRERQEEARRQKEAERKKKAHELWLKRKNFLQTIPGSVVMICTKTHDQVQEYVVTDQEPTSVDCGIFNYKSFEGRELLSAAFAEERKKTGILHGDKFKVIGVVFAQDHARDLPEHMLPVLLTIKADGGYISSIRNRNYELVDLLVYSPLSQRYELMRGTYDKEEGFCYTDIGIFRRYVREHGNPRASVEFSSAASRKSNHFDLRSESVLMGYGYNVSEANKLSERERREMLAEIVDLGILTVHQIVNLLDFNCRLHCGDRYYMARTKWEGDKDFIGNYRVNPDRFLIAQIKGKK